MRNIQHAKFLCQNHPVTTKISQFTADMKAGNTTPRFVVTNFDCDKDQDQHDQDQKENLSSKLVKFKKRINSDPRH